MAAIQDEITTKEPETFWEEAAVTRWGRYITAVEHRAIQKAHQLAGQPSTALEVGAEGGRWAQMLSDLGWQMICTDIDPETLAVCQERIPTAKCITVDVDTHEIPCGLEELRLLLCIEVHQVLETDWFVEESLRVLEPGGVLVGVFQNRRSLRALIKNRIDSFVDYAAVYSQWRTKCVDSGFKMVSEEGICWFPFGRRSNSPLIPASVTLERLLGLRRLPSVSPWIVVVAQKAGNA